MKQGLFANDRQALIWRLRNWAERNVSGPTWLLTIKQPKPGINGKDHIVFRSIRLHKLHKLAHARYVHAVRKGNWCVGELVSSARLLVTWFHVLQANRMRHCDSMSLLLGGQA